MIVYIVVIVFMVLLFSFMGIVVYFEHVEAMTLLKNADENEDSL